MRVPDIAEEMMRKTVRAVSLPVTVKMRLGWDRDHLNAADLARRAQDAGIREITVHGRTREQQYSGEADWDQIALVAASVDSPVYGNGEIWDGATALRRMRESGVAGVVIGRGAMGNPWIFREIRQMSEHQVPTPVTDEERFRMIETHYRRLLAW